MAVRHCCAHSQHSQGPISQGQAHQVCPGSGCLWQPLHVKDASSSIELPQILEVRACGAILQSSKDPVALPSCSHCASWSSTRYRTQLQ